MKSGFIDGHAHLPPAPGSGERLLGLMDVMGIEHAVVVAGGAITPHQLSVQMAIGGLSRVSPDNARVLAECRVSAGRLIPFFFANPHVGDEEYRRDGSLFAGL